jgi:hypothetical protein
MKNLFRKPRSHLLCDVFLSFLVCAVSSSHEASGQLTGTYHSALGTTATYQYQNDGLPTVQLPADITVTFSGDTPTTMLTATIHQPIIGDTAGNFDYEIVNEFPLVVTGSSFDGRDFEGELLPNSQYYFDWQFEPAENGELTWTGQVSWVGGRIEVSTINPGARLIPSVLGDYNQDGDVDAADYVVWRDALEIGGPGRPDGNHDGQIDAGDYDVWRTAFGNSLSPSATAAQPAPEPTTGLMVIIAFGWFAIVRARIRISYPFGSQSFQFQTFGCPDTSLR